MKTRALFVDDEPLVLSGLGRMLRNQRRDWDFAFAGSAAEALQALAEAPFDVVMSDMRMPGKDGGALLQEVAQAYPGVARFVLSGHAEFTAVLRAIRPAHRYFGKPCDSGEINAALAAVRAVRLDPRQGALCRKLGAHRRLPSPERTLDRLSAALQAPNVPAAVADVIEGDIAMSAQFLRLVNSAFFGAPIATLDVRVAVETLGTETLRALMEEVSLFRPAEQAGGAADAAVAGINAAAAEAAAAAGDCIEARARARLAFVGPLASIEASDRLSEDEQGALTEIMLAFWGLAPTPMTASEPAAVA